MKHSRVSGGIGFYCLSPVQSLLKFGIASGPEAVKSRYVVKLT